MSISVVFVDLVWQLKLYKVHHGFNLSLNLQYRTYADQEHQKGRWLFDSAAGLKSCVINQRMKNLQRLCLVF